MIDDENPTLKFAQSKGMKIVRVSKDKYKHHKQELADTYPHAYHVPEGGNNQLGRNGMSILAEELKQDFADQQVRLLTPIGTACTMGGLINFLPNNFHVLGVNVLKNLGIEEELGTWIESAVCNYEINHHFHFGGYARTNQELVNFINKFSANHKIQLDPIYTSKMLYATFELIEKNYFNEGENIVVLHPGGLQGIEPFNQRYGNKYGLIKSIESVSESP